MGAGPEDLRGGKIKPHQLGVSRALRREMARRGSPSASGRMHPHPLNPLPSALYYLIQIFVWFNDGAQRYSQRPREGIPSKTGVLMQDMGPDRGYLDAIRNRSP